MHSKKKILYFALSGTNCSFKNRIAKIKNIIVNLIFRPSEKVEKIVLR